MLSLCSAIQGRKLHFKAMWRMETRRLEWCEFWTSIKNGHPVYIWVTFLFFSWLVWLLKWLPQQMPILHKSDSFSSYLFKPISLILTFTQSIHIRLSLSLILSSSSSISNTILKRSFYLPSPYVQNIVTCSFFCPLYSHLLSDSLIEDSCCSGDRFCNEPLWQGVRASRFWNLWSESFHNFVFLLPYFTKSVIVL